VSRRRLNRITLQWGAENSPAPAASVGCRCRLPVPAVAGAGFATWVGTAILNFALSRVPSRAQISQTPNGQRSLGARWVVLDPVDRLPRQPGFLSDPRDARGLLGQQGARAFVLLPRVARLPAKVRSLTLLLGVLDTGPLRGVWRNPSKRFASERVDPLDWGATGGRPK
jgi:hypothetical protein